MEGRDKGEQRQNAERIEKGEMTKTPVYPPFLNPSLLSPLHPADRVTFIV